VTIVVVGGGATGLLVASRLAQSAQHVAVLARPGTAEALRNQSIRLSQQSREHIIESLPVASEPALLPAEYRQPDLAILCVKSYATQAALPTLHALQPWQILTLQNGLGNEEVLVAEFGAEHVLSGVLTSSVERESAAHIRVTRTGGIGIAGLTPTPRIRVWSAVLSKSGFKVREYADWRAMKWSKALLNMLGNATAAILDLPVADVYADPRLVDLEHRALLEALQVMQQRKTRPVNLPAYPVALLAASMRSLPPSVLFPLLRRMVAGGRGGKPPSLHLDLLAGRAESEGEYLYCAVDRAARAVGHTAPVNALLWQTLHDIATGRVPWDTFRHQPEKLLDAVHHQLANPV
jgi:2-dehydropantoate 2-reductase